MSVHYLGATEIVEINAAAIELSGGSFGVREPGLLESIAVKPEASFGGEDLYPDLFLKAAVLFEAIVNYHVFVDGNKRTGLAAMARFLAKNGYQLEATNTEMVSFTVSIATDKPDLADIAIWIRERSASSS